MAELGVMPVVAFLAVSSLALMVVLVAGGRRTRLDQRLREFARPNDPATQPDAVADFAKTALPKMGKVLLPKTEGDRTRLQARLVQAGLYSRQAMVVFLGVKLALMVGPAAVGAVAGLIGLVPFQYSVLVGALLGTFGMIGPSFWLDSKKNARQTNFRRALPDALDVLIICLEGGASLAGALRRVSNELRTAHPLLATELQIVQQEIQLGRSAGDALKQFAHRADLEELRSLTAVILQSERFGASLVKGLRVHAETLRTRRVLAAEEMAQKANVKLLFPTILFIMPALFIAILGPVGIMIWETLLGMNR
ncbi:MAG TPA: type II secretion system F family protein [Fimbriiglobus sp.]|nr:type II secretion system F family protein [Fimbriiglobus sp.]